MTTSHGAIEWAERGSGPLNGLRVFDFTELAPGPYMTQALSEMGADVIKVERPPVGDLARRLQPGAFAALNRGKRSILLDLKCADDAAVAERLAIGADILIEGFRPGTMARLGFGYERLRMVNARLIYVSLTGYGQEGPLIDQPGHDINFLAASGVIALSGGLGRPPSDALGLPIGDFVGGLYALSAALAALDRVRRTGVGQWLDVSIVDCLMHLMNMRLGHFRHTGIDTLERQRDAVFNKPGYGVFETADGKHVALAALEPHFWRRLVSALALSRPGEHLSELDLAGRTVIADALNGRIASAIRERSVAELLDLLAQYDVPASRVLTPNELTGSPHATARDLVDEDQAFVRFPVRMASGGEAAP